MIEPLPEERIKRELEIVGDEIDAAKQHLYAYLAIHSIAKRRKKVLHAINEQPLFWMTVTGALQTSALITLRRIFDQNSNHNIDVLNGLFQRNKHLFTKEALAKRKGAAENLKPIWLGKYMESVYEPSHDDFRYLKKSVNKARQIYEKRFRDLGHKVFAHLELHGPTETESVTKMANIHELKKLLSTLTSISHTLFNMFHNGHKPEIKKLRFAAKPKIDRKTPEKVHERIYQQAEEVLLKLSGQTVRVEKGQKSKGNRRATAV